LRRSERISLEEGRKALIHKASLYRKEKGHRITIIFDGWESGSYEEERDREGGIDIIYSRRGIKADEVIKGIVQRGGDDLVVITSDRDIAHFTVRRGYTVISSPEFEEKLIPSDNDLRKRGIGDNNDEDSESIRPQTKKKGPAHRLSKSKKNVLAKLQKL